MPKSFWDLAITIYKDARAGKVKGFRWLFCHEDEAETPLNEGLIEDSNPAPPQIENKLKLKAYTGYLEHRIGYKFEEV